MKKSEEIVSKMVKIDMHIAFQRIKKKSLTIAKREEGEVVRKLDLLLAGKESQAQMKFFEFFLPRSEKLGKKKCSYFRNV